METDSLLHNSSNKTLDKEIKIYMDYNGSVVCNTELRCTKTDIFFYILYMVPLLALKYNTPFLNIISMFISILPAFRFILNMHKIKFNGNVHFLINIGLVFMYLVMVLLITLYNQEIIYLDDCAQKNDTMINCYTISKECYKLYNTLKKNNIQFNVTEFKCD